MIHIHIGNLKIKSFELYSGSVFFDIMQVDIEFTVSGCVNVLQICCFVHVRNLHLYVCLAGHILCALRNNKTDV